jgi:hypothetical protein
VDREYEEAVIKYNSSKLPAHLSREEAIGNYIDAKVRQSLKDRLNSYDIRFGPRQEIAVNSKDPSTANQSYRIPDARIGAVSFDWTLTFKTLSNPQIQGFFSADSEPEAVVIVRPSQLGGRSTYLIPRPAGWGSRR